MNCNSILDNSHIFADAQLVFYMCIFPKVKIFIHTAFSSGSWSYVLLTSKMFLLLPAKTDHKIRMWITVAESSCGCYYYYSYYYCCCCCHYYYLSSTIADCCYHCWHFGVNSRILYVLDYLYIYIHFTMPWSRNLCSQHDLYCSLVPRSLLLYCLLRNKCVCKDHG